MAGKIRVGSQISCKQIIGRHAGLSKAKGDRVSREILRNMIEPEQRDLNLT